MIGQWRGQWQELKTYLLTVPGCQSAQLECQPSKEVLGIEFRNVTKLARRFQKVHKVPLHFVAFPVCYFWRCTSNICVGRFALDVESTFNLILYNATSLPPSCSSRFFLLISIFVVLGGIGPQAKTHVFVSTPQSMLHGTFTEASNACVCEVTSQHVCRLRSAVSWMTSMARTGQIGSVSRSTSETTRFRKSDSTNIVAPTRSRGAMWNLQAAVRSIQWATWVRTATAPTTIREELEIVCTSRTFDASKIHG